MCCLALQSWTEVLRSKAEKEPWQNSGCSLPSTDTSCCLLGWAEKPKSPQRRPRFPAEELTLKYWLRLLSGGVLMGVHRGKGSS